MDQQRIEENQNRQEEKKEKGEKEEKRKLESGGIYRRATFFMLLLLGLTVVLHVSNKMITKKRFSVAAAKQPLLSFVYIFFYAIIGGVLIFFGIKNFNDFLKLYMKDVALVDLTSVSVVIAFVFLYSAYFKEIIATLTGVKISIDVYKNVLGYVLARIVLIALLFLVR